jgi:Mg2+-importing ATPase
MLHQFLYVFIATSAHFGTILSMAGGSLVLSFPPLLPKHMLLTGVESLLS